MALHLVTGGAGFIGSHLAAQLAERGNAVRILDNESTGSSDNLKDLSQRVEFIKGDIRDPEALKQAVRGVECVFHLAALPSVQRSVKFPLESEAVNTMGTLQVLEAAKAEGVGRVVYSSSSSVYGNTATLPKHEGQQPNPLSPYALSKLSGEWYCRIYFDLYGLETVALRYFNVFGPRQDPGSDYAAVIPRFIHAHLCGEPPMVFGDGDQTRDFTFVSNAVDANLRAATAEKAPGQTFNVACGTRTSLNELLALLRKITGSPVEADYGAARPGDVRDSQADISLAREILGYKPAVELAKGLQTTVEWFKQNTADSS